MSNNTATDLTIPGDEFIAPERRPLIAEGAYEAQCIKIEKAYSHSSSRKLFLHFKIFDVKNFKNPPVLFMAMNDPGKKVSAATNYYKNWVIANGNRVPKRKDRMPLKVFQNGIFEVRVETVKPRFPDGEERPECFHYSVVRYIKRRLAGGN